MNRKKQKLEASKLIKIARLIASQERDSKSDRISKSGREFTVDPSILDSVDFNGLSYNRYHGFVRDDV